MDTKHQVELSPDFIDRSWQWARQVVEDYASGRHAASRAVTCFDAHSNIKLQAFAKMSECAFAIWAGTDPNSSIAWNRHCDDGADFTWRGKRWDVKATASRSKYLIWPIAKNHIYQSKNFDMLVLVKHGVSHFQIAGFISKNEFYELKRIADDRHVLFPGTWYVHENDLWLPDLLLSGLFKGAA